MDRPLRQAGVDPSMIGEINDVVSMKSAFFDNANSSQKSKKQLAPSIKAIT